MSTPRPPWGRSSKWAPTCTDIRPATSLIGASNGRSPDGSWTVS
jgi:hypothetical protein